MVVVKASLYMMQVPEIWSQRATSNGLDFGEMLEYGRKTGNKNLRKMTFQERGRMLKALAMFLLERKEKYYQISYKTGATKVDSWIDIEGGIGNLFANASLRRKLPDLPYYSEGDAIGLSKGGTFIGHHILVPKEGVAVHINAFNFPVWGMLEKCAVNWACRYASYRQTSHIDFLPYGSSGT
jgi:oxepin-CoA hydrolase/3-oxo-5,6-dehydrosuberyl-CoA semialdehyde dehydrogenase